MDSKWSANRPINKCVKWHEDKDGWKLVAGVTVGFITGLCFSLAPAKDHGPLWLLCAMQAFATLAALAVLTHKR